MGFTLEQVKSIIQNKDWRTADRAILSCHDILARVRELKQIHGEANVGGALSTKTLQSAYQYLIKGFKAGKKLDSVSIPGLKGEPKNGNFRVLMYSDSDCIEVPFEEVSQREIMGLLEGGI